MAERHASLSLRRPGAYPFKCLREPFRQLLRRSLWSGRTGAIHPEAMMRKALISLVAVVAVVTSARDARAQAPTLYDRLGGAYAIASVVDVFIDLLLHNDVLNQNPAIRAARSRVPAPGLKFHVTTLVCQVTGGPCAYAGRSMKEAHAHLDITDREWQAMLNDFQRVLNDFQVPAREQEELMAIIASTRGDIVVGRSR